MKFWGYIQLGCIALLQTTTAKAQTPLSFNITRFEASVAGKICDTIKKAELLSAKKIMVSLKKQYRIIGYTCRIKSFNGKDTLHPRVKSLTGNSASFTPQMLKAFQGSTGITRICFTGIQCEGLDKKPIKLNDVNLALTEWQPRGSLDTVGTGRWRFSFLWNIFRRRTRWQVPVFKMSVAGKEGGHIRRQQLIDAGGVNVQDWMKGKVVSYKVTVITTKGRKRTKRATDEHYTPEIEELLENAKPGSKVIFRSIKWKRDVGGTITRRLEFKLKQNFFTGKDV